MMLQLVTPFPDAHKMAILPGNYENTGGIMNCFYYNEYMRKRLVINITKPHRTNLLKPISIFDNGGGYT